ncbi:MAG: DNA-processing protein DprA [Myxococcota bacterium]|nr:DNA-processing protein DprA [Myxococcota bacterium]
MQNPKIHMLPSIWHSAMLREIDVSSLMDTDTNIPEESLINFLQAENDLPSPTPFITWNNPNYPSFLKRQPKAPPVLFYRGNLSLLTERVIGIVGTRKCTQNGRNMARQIASVINQAGLCTISGLAYGIDKTVHLSSLSKTIGILPCGFSSITSPQIQTLTQTILEQNGLILSEFLPHHPPRKWRFIRRNRLIAWLAEEIVIVEAPPKSGALHTAQFALEAGQSLWAVPCSPLQNTGAGCLNLIQAGARPLCNLKQFAFHLGISYTEKEIFNVSEFAQKLNLNETQALRILMKKVIDGQIKTLSNGYYQWI